VSKLPEPTEEQLRAVALELERLDRGTNFSLMAPTDVQRSQARAAWRAIAPLVWDAAIETCARHLEEGRDRLLFGSEHAPPGYIGVEAVTAVVREAIPARLRTLKAGKP